MLTGSVTSLIQILFGLLLRILSEGFQIDWTLTNIAWCKIRNYITLCTSLTALSCFVLMAIDRFFSTCRQIKWRHLNSTYLAKYICLFIIIISMLINIPTLVYSIPEQGGRVCTSSSILWSSISTYFFNLFFYGIFPWLFMSIFGLLTLRNVRTAHHRRIRPLPIPFITRMARIDKHLTSILFLQIIISIISSIPYCIQTLYDNLTQTIVKSEYRQAQENLFLQIVRLTFYLNYISMFYVDYLSSGIFRRLSRKVVINVFKKKADVSREITIINHQRKHKQLERKRLNIFTIDPPHTTSRV